MHGYNEFMYVRNNDYTHNMYSCKANCNELPCASYI